MSIFAPIKRNKNEIQKNSSKLSGEALMGDLQYGIDPKRLAEYADEIKQIHDKGVEIAIVIGGGNIFRGVSGVSSGMDRVQGDYMGCFLLLMEWLCKAHWKIKHETCLQTALKMESIAEPYKKEPFVI
jgi:uridylate kinase